MTKLFGNSFLLAWYAFFAFIIFLPPPQLCHYSEYLKLSTPENSQFLSPLLFPAFRNFVLFLLASSNLHPSLLTSFNISGMVSLLFWSIGLRTLLSCPFLFVWVLLLILLVIFFKARLKSAEEITFPSLTPLSTYFSVFPWSIFILTTESSVSQ